MSQRNLLKAVFQKCLHAATLNSSTTELLTLRLWVNFHLLEWFSANLLDFDLGREQWLVWTPCTGNEKHWSVEVVLRTSFGLQTARLQSD